MLEAGIDKVREKSVQLSEYMIFLFEKWLSPLGFELGSPRNPNSRGSHLSFKHPEAYRITQSLIQPLESQPTVIPDFRAPDFIRLGITPLYVGYSDVYRSLLRIREIVETKEYERHSLAREKVT